MCSLPLGSSDTATTDIPDRYFQMAIYEGDQSTSTIMVIKGIHASVSAATLKASAPAGSVYTFTASFNHIFNGREVSYRKGVSYVLDASLKSALQALGAPMTAA